ncbi:hypothetical protein EV426DRAFT_634131 [Tirmania nivea]|nr:hypothetical protein EV426DRAFT_634131 [Tirmania nivea]
MDLAYDHVQEAVIDNPEGSKPSTTSGTTTTNNVNLNVEFNEAYKAISNSPWGMKFGGWLGEVKKQGESYYSKGVGAAAGVNVAGVAETASRGLVGLKEEITGRMRGLSLSGKNPTPPPPLAAGEKEGFEREKAEQENGLMERLKKNAAKRIEEIEKAEAKADEYLLKWGTTIGNFLKEAITVAPPEGEEFADEVSSSNPTNGPGVLFDQGTSSREGEGKRQIYTTRLDAQLHILHTSHDLFFTNPSIPSFTDWSTSFSADKRTEQIASDLDTYPELRSTMEKLVPADVTYEDFFKRYYFLRAELDTEEQKRKELLKGALEEEEIGWDSDPEGEESGGEDEDEKGAEKKDAEDVERAQIRSQASTETLQAPSKPGAPVDTQSAADSDTSYDIVSGAPSRSGGSPKEMNKKPADDDTDDDWE